MRSGQCFILLHCYVITLATKPRSVNLALETTFEFNNKQDVAIIQKVRNFLNKIENAVDTKLAERSRQTGFTDFLQDLILTINTYGDNDFKQVFRVLDDVVMNFKSKDKKFNEIYNEGLKSQLSDILKKINRAPATFLRSQLKKNIKAMQKNDMNVDFLNFLNTIYKKKSMVLKKTLDNFKKYGKKTRTSDADVNLKDVIRDAVKSVVYDLYRSLNNDTKNDLKAWMKRLTRNRDFVTKVSKTEKVATRKYRKRKNVIVHKKYTFVTLYPELITDMKLKKTTVTTEKKNIKEFTTMLSNEDVHNDESLDYDPPTKQPQLKRATLPWHTIPRPKVQYPPQPFRINPFNYNLPSMLRRTELEKGNETCSKDISTNYLSKIKTLEDELHRVREQLKAKMITFNKDGGDVDKYFRVSEPSTPAIRDITEMIELTNITNKYSEELSKETQEMSFALPYNVTYGQTNHSLHISNQTSMEMFSPEPVNNVTTYIIYTVNLTKTEDTTVASVNETVSAGASA